MTAVKQYLLRLILCGFLVSLAGALLRDRKGGRALALCGGCLLILTALRPLLRVDLRRLPDLATGLTQSQRAEEAREKNDALLRGLVERQTAAWVEEQARELGMELRCAVTARAAEAGCFVPEALELRGSWTEAQRRSLSERLTAELEIPPERQRWVAE